MSGITLFFLLIYPYFAFGHIIPYQTQDKEVERIEFIVDLITLNFKTNGWNNILCVGHLPDAFYNKINRIHFTLTLTDVENEDHAVDDVVPYHSNIIILNCENLDDFERALLKAQTSPYWHALSHIILYYHETNQDDIAKISYIFWFYSASNAIIIQYDDSKETLLISQYNQYITESYKLQKSFGCWKATKYGRALTNFKDSFVCVEGCHNISINSKLRIYNMGTCMGLDTHIVQYGNRKSLQELKLFEDKGKNLHGFVFRAYVVEVLPFLKISVKSDGGYSLESRDGMVWNVTSNLMNFVMDVSPSKDVMKKPFEFEVNIQQIFKFSRRQADLVLFPVYLMDVVIVEIDRSIAYADSGVCVMSHRAGFETKLFELKFMEENVIFVSKFVLCFLLIWLMFFTFNVIEKHRLNFDEAGKAFVNTIRNILSISIYNQPSTRRSFRIFLSVTMWSFFAINFATQAAIISFFTAFKRGKNVDTFEDVIEKGYIIESMPSPDMMLPETEERFVKINSKLVPISDFVTCLDNMTNDSRRFCLIDCSIGRYLEVNRLNSMGQQYLHIATEDQFHSHYLTMIFHKYSPLTYTFNRYMRIFFEAGLIKKWEQYRFADIKEEGQVKPLGMDDLIGILKGYCLLLEFSSAVFVLEVVIGILGNIKCYLTTKWGSWRRTHAAKKILKLEKKLDKLRKQINMSTQTGSPLTNEM